MQKKKENFNEIARVKIDGKKFNIALWIALVADKEIVINNKTSNA